MRINLLYFILILSGFSSCVNDKEEGLVISDATLFDLSQNSSSFLYFKNSTDTLTAAPESAHPNFVRVRFNPKARSAMNDSLDKLILPAFPDESMIVKEIYNQKGGPLVEYVMIYKMHNAVNNGSGWIWTDMNPDGSIIYSASHKGDQCLGCHSAEVNADLVRTFSLH